MSSHNKEAADLSNIKLPKHEPTIAIEEILAGYGGSDRQDVWESIQAYADIHARSALTASEAPATEQAPAGEVPEDLRGQANDLLAEARMLKSALGRSNWPSEPVNLAALSTPPAGESEAKLKDDVGPRDFGIPPEHCEAAKHYAAFMLDRALSTPPAVPPKGWTLVPVEYTDEQIAAGIAQLEAVRAALGDGASDESICGIIYDGMLSAAPAAPQGE